MKKIFYFAIMAFAFLLNSCAYYEGADEDESVETIGQGKALLHVRANPFSIVPFDTRSTKTLRDVSTRMSYAFFNLDGEKVMSTKSQKVEDSNYGNLDVLLDPGKYILVVVAHNGTDNCTISSPTEVKFAKNKMTDTFSSCDTLTVENGEQTASIVLMRRVAMLRLRLDEVLPRDVVQLKIYYTGGSSTLDASTGFGCVNSRQTEILDVPESAYDTSGSLFEVYTIPHATTGLLKVTVSALNAAGNVVAEKEIVNVPIRQGEITEYSGTITGSSNNGLQFILSVDDRDWTHSYHTF